ncbi:MAG: MBL fold metallo-hydrolase [Muribaculaceae bacterium]|nr:MBL fold metallo-hydrolase [Muribaculaceae bacterium]
MTKTRYQIEMLDVGNGDCFIIQYFHKESDYTLIMVDAGSSGNGDSIMRHLNKYYPEHDVDYAIVTHSDEDHYGGFLDILAKLEEPKKDGEQKNDSEVKPVGIKKFIINGISSSLYDYKELDKFINRLRIPVEEKYKGDSINECPILFLSPSREKFESFEYAFDGMDSVSSIFESILNEKSIKSIDDYEDDKSYTNASSIVFLFHPDDKKFLFTGDATRKTLNDVLKEFPKAMTDCDWLKVPHHGSVSNLTTHLIDTLNPKTSYISAAGDDKHPSRDIVTLLESKGDVYITSENHTVMYRSGTPLREGWGPTDSHKS